MYLIVGIDAGIKAGYAALDLNGNLVSAGCEKELSEAEMVKIIRNIGIPSIVACDVKKAPSFVSKIAARFNVSLFSPGKDISVDEKKKMGGDIMDPHMRDAYSAALKAYRQHANRLRQVDKLHTEQDKAMLKHLVLQGHALTKMLQGKKQTARKPSRKAGKPAKPRGKR